MADLLPQIRILHHQGHQHKNVDALSQFLILVIDSKVPTII